MAGRVAVVGTGLIGGSVGLALAARHFEVVGFDHDQARLTRAKELGAITEAAVTLAEAVVGADLVIVAVPVGAIAATVVEALDAGAAVVTDVGSVKAPVVAEVERERPEASARFVGGHPMAGSEQEGVDGADATLFVGSTWVLTPTSNTDERAYTHVLRVIRDLGADVVDGHAAASRRVRRAGESCSAARGVHADGRRIRERTGSADDAAARGRRLSRHDADCRRAPGHLARHPGDEPRRGARRARFLRRRVDAGPRDRRVGLARRPAVAARARRAPRAATFRSVCQRPPTWPSSAIPVPDRPGVIAEVTTLAGRLGVNVIDVEIAHSPEGGRGVIVLLVAVVDADAYESGLRDLGYHVSRTDLA